MAALAGVAAVMNALPTSFKMPDGTIAAPRALLGRQLLAAQMTPLELSTVLDYGSDPAKLGRVTAALNDPTLHKPLGGAQDRALDTAVKAAMAPFLATQAPLPGEEGLAQARIDRTILVAKSLMAGQHLSAMAAAQAAAGDMTGQYRFVDTWRMPAALAGQTSVDLGGIHSGADLARDGARKMMGGLVEAGGPHLYAPNGGSGGDAQRRIYAQQVQHNGHWVTLPDESGLTLMVPHQDGSWDQVADRYGRPVRATWSELQAVSQGRAQPSYLSPPAGQPNGPNGKPAPAASKAAAHRLTRCRASPACGRARRRG